MKDKKDDLTEDLFPSIIKCVVPISTGKDSQVCLELALTQFDKSEIIGLFCDTQWESKTSYRHLIKMRSMYGVKIVRITAGSVIDQVRKRGNFPSGKVRFCTDNLKIKPGRKFYIDLAKEQGQGFEIWYGMRWGESKDRAKRYEHVINDDLYAPHEIMPSKYPQYMGKKLGIKFRLPIVDWSDEEVFEYLGDRINPLYSDAQVDRVGCFPCFAAGDKLKERVLNHDPSRKIQVLDLMHEVGKNIFSAKSVIARNPDMYFSEYEQAEESDGPACAVCTI